MTSKNDCCVREYTTTRGTTLNSTVSDTEPIDNPKLIVPPTSTDSIVPEKSSSIQCGTLKQQARTKKKVLNNIQNLQKIIKKLQMKKNGYAMRLEKVLLLSENKMFQKCLQKPSVLGALFTMRQFREIAKENMGRKFTIKQNIMALNLYRQDPKAYRWLSETFILPSPVTLSRLISHLGLRPGLNKKNFIQINKMVQKMTKRGKLCILLFDEISITPDFDINRKRDIKTGVLTNEMKTKRDIADHALIFMLRGILKDYNQLVAYTFCKRSTAKDSLKVLLKQVIKKLQKCGLKVLATVCDQSTTNVSAIKQLINETREDYIRRDKVLKNKVFEVNGQEIVPLFDPPHLIKGIRNSLITNKLKCVIKEEVKIADWDHIIKLHENNPAYNGISLIQKLTDVHVNPKKMSKMKVKLATQVFSRTVAAYMGFLANKGILPANYEDTADVLLFFDQLFDSVNGSYENSRKRTEKILLRPVTRRSKHSEVWANAKKVLKSMTFVTNEGREIVVPSIRNWLISLENIDILRTKLFNKYKFKSFWMRRFNQDPLEDFFCCILSDDYRNISPIPSD